MTSVKDVDSFIPIELRLDAIDVKDDQAVLEIYVQPWENFAPADMILPAHITLTLPAQVKLIEGDLTWETKLAPKEIFLRQVKIKVGELNSAAVLHLFALIGDRQDPFRAVGKGIVLCVRQRVDGELEFSQDYYFGEGYSTPVGGSVLTPTPENFKILDDSSGVKNLPPVSWTETPIVKITSTPVPKITSTPIITLSPDAYP
ncbi:MAG: hypothetical protein AB1894_04795 [Chloroflexota bacterium]